MHHDFTIQVREIIGGVDRPWDFPEIEQKLADIHGVKVADGVVNGSGVFEEREEVIVRGCNRGACQIKVRLVRTPRGHWLNALSLDVGIGGVSWAPSIYNRHGWSTKEEALEAGLKEGLTYCHTNDSDKGTAKMARLLVAAINLRLQEIQPEQMRLF